MAASRAGSLFSFEGQQHSGFTLAFAVEGCVGRERERYRQTDREREREREREGEREREVGPIPTFHVRIGGLKDFNVALIARVIDFSFGLCLFHGVRAKSESPLDLHDGPGSLQMPGCSHCVLL